MKQDCLGFWCHGCCLRCSLRGCNDLALKDDNGQPLPPTPVRTHPVCISKHLHGGTLVSMLEQDEGDSGEVAAKTEQMRGRGTRRDWCTIERMRKVYVGTDLRHVVC